MSFLNCSNRGKRSTGMLQASESPQIIFLFPDQHGTLSSDLLAMNTLPLESRLTHINKSKEQTRWLWLAIWKRANNKRLYIQHVIDVNTESFFLWNIWIVKQPMYMIRWYPLISTEIRNFIGGIWRPTICLSNFSP